MLPPSRKYRPLPAPPPVLDRHVGATGAVELVELRDVFVWECESKSCAFSAIRSR